MNKADDFCKIGRVMQVVQKYLHPIQKSGRGIVRTW